MVPAEHLQLVIFSSSLASNLDGFILFVKEFPNIYRFSKMAALGRESFQESATAPGMMAVPHDSPGLLN